MYLVRLWSARPRLATRLLFLSPKPSQPPVYDKDLPDLPCIDNIERISRLALDIPAFEQVFTELGLFFPIQQALLVDIHLLLFLHNIIGESTRKSKQYQETLLIIADSLQHILDTSKELQPQLSLQLPLQLASAKLEIEKNLEITMNAVNTFVLKEASEDKLEDASDIYQRSHRQFRALVINNVQTTPGFSSSTANVPGASNQSGYSTRHPTPGSATPNTSYFNGSQGTTFLGTQSFCVGSSMNLHATNSNIYINAIA